MGRLLNLCEVDDLMRGWHDDVLYIERSGMRSTNVFPKALVAKRLKASSLCMHFLYLEYPEFESRPEYFLVFTSHKLRTLQPCHPRFLKWTPGHQRRQFR
jgi:hypothetical protein